MNCGLVSSAVKVMFFVLSVVNLSLSKRSLISGVMKAFLITSFYLLRK